MWWEDPWEMMRRIRNEIERSMERAFMGMPEISFGVRPWRMRPFADISETADEVIVRIDAPGFEKEDFAINVTENTLEVSAERKEEKAEKGETFFRRERRYGGIRRAMTLPVKVKPEETEAEYKSGVLEIRLKKAVPEKKKRKIKVKVK